MIIEKNVTQTDLIVPKGAVILNYNDINEKLNYLDNGVLHVFMNIDGKDKYIYEISSKRYIIPFQQFLFKNSAYKVVAQVESTLKSLPYDFLLQSFFVSDLSIIKAIISNVLYDFNSLLASFKSFYSFYSNIEMLLDNLLLYILSLDATKDVLMASNDLSKYYEMIKKYEDNIAKNKISFKVSENPKFLIMHNGILTQKTYEMDFANLDISQELINSMISYSKMSENEKDNLIQNGKDFFYYILKSYALEAEKIPKKIKVLYKETDEIIQNMFSIENNLCKIVLSRLLSNKDRKNAQQLFLILEKFYSDITLKYKSYFKIISQPFNFNIKEDIIHLVNFEDTVEKKQVNDINKTDNDTITWKKPNTSEDVTSISNLDTVINNEKINSGTIIMQSKVMQEIYTYANFTGEESELLEKALSMFLKAPDKTADTDTIRKLQKAIRNTFFKLYEKVLLRFFKEGKATRIIAHFLRFGLIDERLLTEEDFKTLSLFKDSTTSKYNIFDPIQWFQLIYSKKLEPSISELGQSYDVIVKEESRRYKKPDEVSLPENEKRLNFEISNFFQNAYRVLTSSPLTALPILFSENLRGKIADNIITREKIADEFNAIKEIDYSLFWREAIYREGDLYDIFKKEVLPYIIILPVMGDRVFLWQDSGSNKYFPARFAFPAIFTGNDLKKAVISACGNFRWEINKTIKGPQWTDPVDGGVTGKYFDYLNFYNKSSEISPEVKQSIKENFAKFRNDRDKFSNDYAQWLQYEANGILKLNLLLRRIFLFEIPFKKDLLLKLQRLPSYEKLINVFMNRRTIEIKKCISKYRKFENKEGNYPDEILKFMEFLKV